MTHKILSGEAVALSIVTIAGGIVSNQSVMAELLGRGGIESAAGQVAILSREIGLATLAASQSAGVIVGDLNSGAMAIADERARQITELGYDVQHDMRYREGELVDMAITYLDSPVGDTSRWPHDSEAPGSGAEFGPGRIADLRAAGALIAAEIDRLQQLEAMASSGG